MTDAVTIRTTGLGLLTWAVPFVVSFLFFDRSGQLAIAQPLFKSLMVVVFGGVGVALLVVAFRRVTPTPLSGLVLGCYWLAINLVLDLAVLVPFAKLAVDAYFVDIGLRYLLIPMIATAMGAVGSRNA
ncbi:MAG: hypothetical protein IBJ17_12410 [Reyranella sp.]|jgi:hypothetical protein|nr:hypothetical protein [Reyranella sp.]